MQQLKAISDDELLRRLAALLRDSRHTEADLVAHVAEVDTRRLYVREATPSMFQYCTERLHLSGPEAYLRIAAARASRQHPVVLAMLADGRLHLTAIALLAPHLTPANRDILLERATHKTKREVEEIVAAIAPRPDAPALMRKLPERRLAGGRAQVATPSIHSPSALQVDQPPSSATTPTSEQVASRGPELRPDGVLSGSSGALFAPALEPTVGEVSVRASEWPERDAGVAEGELRPVEAPTPRSKIESLAPARYRVQFTASAELRDKLERLQALMRSSVPDGDLATIIETAVTEKLEKLQARRFGRTKSPRKAPPKVRPQPRSRADGAPTSRYVPAHVRRAVHERDEERCRYVDAQGRRCTARVSVEFHHRHPFGMGGEHSPANVALLCRAHNRFLAEIDYGRETMARHRRPSVRASG